MIELDELIKKAKQFPIIIIFGFSVIGWELYQILSFEQKDKDIFFCDNNKEKQAQKEVYPVHDAAACYPKALFVTASLYHYQEMIQQLHKENIEDSHIAVYIPHSHRLQNSMESMLRRIVPMPELQFEVDLANHCNLNCRYCDHFSPLAEEEYPDFGKFEKDLFRLSFLFKKHAKRIFLLGGEPLLNQKISMYLICARKAFPQTEISIVTNGILLQKMEEHFWNTCRQNRIQIIMTKYPISNTLYKKAEKICEENQVIWSYFVNTSVCKYSYHYPLDLEGKQDARTMYLHCNNANECITLKNGKLYTCSVAPNIDNFNRYFHQELELSEEDGIDIYQVESGQEILQFLSKPIPFCRYCKVYERTYEHPWGISRKEIEEWT